MLAKRRDSAPPSFVFHAVDSLYAHLFRAGCSLQMVRDADVQGGTMRLGQEAMRSGSGEEIITSLVTNQKLQIRNHEWERCPHSNCATESAANQQLNQELPLVQIRDRSKPLPFAGS